MNEDELERREQALLYLLEGEAHQMRGEFGRAIALYMKSIAPISHCESAHMARLDLQHDRTLPRFYR